MPVYRGVGNSTGGLERKISARRAGCAREGVLVERGIGGCLVWIWDCFGTLTLAGGFC